MALTPEQIRAQAADPTQQQGLFNLVKSGQLNINDVYGAVGTDSVNNWLSQYHPDFNAPSTAPTPPAVQTPTNTVGGKTPVVTGGATNVATPGNLGTVTTNTSPSNPNPTNNPTTYPTPIPAAPNYWNSAQAQGAENLNAAKNTVSLSNPDINGPYGSQTVSVGPDGRPVVNQSLSADLQARRDALNGILPGLTDQISAQLGKQPGWHVTQGVDSPTVGGVSTIADALRAREQPRFDRQRQQQEAQLLARGFNPGTEGWKNALDDINRQENDFNLGLVNEAGNEQSRLFNLQSSLRGQQTNEEQLLRTLPIQNYAQLVQAMQPNAPQFQQYQGAQVEAAPYFGATNAQGLFDLGRYGTMIQGELGTRGVDNAISSNVNQTITKALFG